jgi:hypothetical protein
MRLQSVLDLKEELKEAPPAPKALVRALRVEIGSRALSSKLAGTHTGDVPAPSMAVGVAAGRRRGDYRLGVRVQARGHTAAALIKNASKRASGEIDARIVPRVSKRNPPAAWFRAFHRPVEAGLSVGHQDITAGTLGFVVEDDDSTYILSNNHVLANVNAGSPGDAVLQPGPADRTPTPKTLVAVLDRFISISFRRSNVVDCALAELVDDMQYWVGWTEALPGRVRGAAELSEDDLGLPVRKAGRTTGVTRGFVSQVGIDRLQVDMGDEGRPQVAVFSDQFEVQGDGGRPFSLGGDSGSLIVDERGYARGLLFAGGEDAEGLDLTFSNQITRVLSKLGVRLAT